MIFVFILAGISAIEAFQWTSSTVIPTGSTVSACTGSNVRLPWGYRTDPEEHVIDVEWSFQGKGQSKRTIASDVRGNFLVTPNAIQSIQPLASTSGLELLNVTEVDNGLYTIDVNINLHGSVVAETQNVTLQVVEMPVSADGRINVDLVPEVVQDNFTGQWSAKLRCGVFTSLGQPPVSVVWKSPTNQILPTSYYHGGSFYLSIPNPPERGEYSCQLQSGPVSQCLESDSPLLSSSSLDVDTSQIQFLILSGRLRELEKENEELKSESAWHQSEIEQLTSQLRQQQTANQHLNERVDNLTSLLVAAARRPENCEEVQQYDQQSGVHTLYVNNTSFTAYCDQTTDGGGWTTIVKRFDGSVDFNRSWQSYEDGFGNKSGEYWLGLSIIHALTTGGNYSLRVDIHDFDGSTAYAVYDEFRVKGPDTTFSAHVTGYSGTAGDSLDRPPSPRPSVNYMRFSTYDNDNDIEGDNCAAVFACGWWHADCFSASPTGRYHAQGGLYDDNGMAWYSWHNNLNSYKAMDLKLRPSV